MKNLLVIHELDKQDNEQIVIGVCDSKINADLLVEEYYGAQYMKEVSFNDVRDSNIECIRVLQINDYINQEHYNVVLTYEWFELNK